MTLFKLILKVFVFGKILLFVIFGVANVAAGEKFVNNGPRNNQSVNQEASLGPPNPNQGNVVQSRFQGLVAVKIERCEGIDKKRLQSEVEEALYRRGYDVVSVDNNKYEGVSYMLIVQTSVISHKKLTGQKGNASTWFKGMAHEQYVVEASVKMIHLVTRRAVAFGKGQGDSTNLTDTKIGVDLLFRQQESKDLKYLSSLSAAVDAIEKMN